MRGSPGPWRLVRGHESQYELLDARGDLVAELNFLDDRADEKLIERAPEYRAALAELVALKDAKDGGFLVMTEAEYRERRHAAWETARNLLR